MIHSCVIPDDPPRWQVALLDTWLFIWYLTALVNPLIYASRVPEFREEFRKICCGLIKRRRINQVDPYHGVHPMKGSIRPRREFGYSQPETEESTIPTVTTSVSESKAYQNTGGGKQLLKVPKRTNTLSLETRPYILNERPQERKQGNSNSGNSLWGNSVDTAGELDAIPSVTLHRLNVEIYSRYRRQ